MPLRDSTHGWTDARITDYYMRWREVALVVAKRNGVLVCNKMHEGFFRDMVDRLMDDPWWKLQNAGIELTMMAHPLCPEDELLIWDGKGPLLRMRQFLGTDKGFGSFGRIAAPNPDGVVDWGTAFDALSKSEAKRLLRPTARPKSQPEVGLDG